MPPSIDISLSAPTIDALQGMGSALYVLKAVKYGFRGVPFTPPNAMLRKAASPATGGGAPVLARILTTYALRTTISWPAAVEAYVSTSPIADQQRIAVGQAVPADPGQTVTVSSSGLLAVISGGGEGAVSILNQASSPWTCGLAQSFGADPAPTCAFPLYGSYMAVLTPLDQVLLMFASNLLQAGAVITTAYAPAFLVDAAAADRTVSFDINQGWSANNATWARKVAAETDIGPLLIVT